VERRHLRETNRSLALALALVVLTAAAAAAGMRSHSQGAEGDAPIIGDLPGTPQGEAGDLYVNRGDTRTVRRIVQDLDLQVLLADETPAAGATVIEFTRDPSGGEGMRERRFTTGSDGTVAIPGLAADASAYLLISSADDAQKIVVNLGGPAAAALGSSPREPARAVLGSSGVVQIYPPGRATGQLLDDRGRPAAGVTLHAATWEWLRPYQPNRTARTDHLGRFEFRDLLRGSDWTIEGRLDREDGFTLAWTFYDGLPFPREGWLSWGIEIPDSQRRPTRRPAGRTVSTIMSGVREDRWFDTKQRQWRRPVASFDPSNDWPPAPGGSTWIWHAARPDHTEERYGRTLTFRREFAVPADWGPLVGYLSLNADEYAAVSVNGAWIGQCAQWQSTQTFVIPAEHLGVGTNELRLTVRNGPGGGVDMYNPGGLAYMLELIQPSSDPEV